MGKVKQALQEVEEEVVSLVKTNTSLKDIYVCLGGVSGNNPYLLDKELIKKLFNKAVRERDNEEPYPTEDEIYKRYVYPLDKGEVWLSLLCLCKYAH